jgi:hypothetical protein
VKDRDIHSAIKILRREVPKWQTPIVTLMAETYQSPFRVLISCILSLRTQDATTAKASHRLFALADLPETMLKLTAKKMEKLIYPGFLSNQGKKHPGDLSNVDRPLCRSSARFHRRAFEIQGRWTQDRESRGNVGV